MPTAVLVHGGFHGGWCWKKVSELLLRDGWTVHAPSLTGLGDRAHLASPEVGVETHVRDITGIIEYEELADVVLCGHSAGGVVATAVADRMADRIAHCVFLDATVPTSGQSLNDVMGDGQGVPEIFRKQAAESGDGWLVPPALFSAAAFGVEDPDDQAWVERRMTGHPLRAFDEPVTLSGAFDRIARRTYIRCERFVVDYGERLTPIFEQDPTWHVERWDSAHDVMITEPEKVHEVLVRS